MTDEMPFLHINCVHDISTRPISIFVSSIYFLLHVVSPLAYSRMQ
jgi:hypothetical protein